MNKLIWRGLLNTIGTVLYVALVVTIIHNTERFSHSNNEILTGMTVLTTFILSAAITGGLVLGKPILLYLNGQKNEAVKLFTYTLGWLGVVLILLVLINLYLLN